MLIFLPRVADHFKNARVVTEKGLSVYVDKMAVDDETFARALDAVLHDSRSNLLRVASI